MSETKEVAVADKQEVKSLTFGKSFSLTPKDLAEAMQFSKLIADSDLAPKDFKGKPGNVLIAIQMGMEVGLAPMQAIQNIAVINGRPTIWGDAAIALVLANSVCEYVRESWDEKTQTWTCRGKRRDAKEEGVYTFSLADAEKAGLTKKEGTWQSYRKRMIQMRARAFCLRDNFADVLKGLAIREEVEDYVDTTATVESSTQVQMPKAKEPEPSAIVPANGDSVLIEGEYKYFLEQMGKLLAKMDEVQKCAHASFGVDDLKTLTKSQAKKLISIWSNEPTEGSK